MKEIYSELIYRPILNALVFIYNNISLGDLGLAIIILTILFRLVLYPLFQKQVRYQATMQRIQPKLKKIQQEHKGNMEKQSQATLAIYKEHNINPFSGFVVILIQLPLLFALYHVFTNIFKPETFSDLYSFVVRPAELNPIFAGFFDLSQHNYILVFVTALAQYFQGKLSLGARPVDKNSEDTAQKIGQSMVWMAPLITLVVFAKLPAAVVLYWLVSTAFSIGQQILVNKQIQENEHRGIPEKTS